MSGTTSTGAYHTSNGQIIAPNGAAFVARGVNVMEGNNPSAAVLQQDFPGINFVRLAVYNYESPDTLLAYVNDLTSHGIVVELEDHNNNAGGAGGSQGQIFTGQALTTELNWYSAVGAAFKNNPNVWFGTNNEPSSTNASGQNDPAALSHWQAQTVQAVRDAGNNNPVLIEANSWGPGGTNVGYDPAAYANLHNVVWDIHYYGWLSKYSTDQATVSSTLSGMISDTRQITSADGTMPVIIGEYGNSTTGTTFDANGTQVITAVQQSGVGNVAWAWYPGSPGDGLNDGGNGLSAYGQQVAAGIAAAAAKATVIPSANNTVVTGTTAAITDASGNKWTITTGGQVAINGKADTTTGGVIELAYVNGKIWQENSSKLWWGETQPNASWAPTAGTATSPLPVPIIPSANNTIVTGTTAAITDASGNKWTITTGGQVAINGKADTTTGSVIELAYVGGKIWQENSSKLWWGETLPNASWAPTAGTATSPLPAPITIAATQTSATISASRVSVTSTSGNHMVFISGTGDIVALAGGTNTITDTGKGNTYVIPAAGKGYDNFTSNILNTGDTLDLRTALAATNWTGTTATLAKYLSVVDNSQGAVLSIAPTSGGAGVAIATINGATTASLTTLLAHSIA